MRAAILLMLCAVASAAEADAPRTSLIPVPRPVDLAELPVQATLLCADPRLIGEAGADLSVPRDGCGIADPVRLSSVAGIALSSTLTLNCDTARTLADWIVEDLQPAFATRAAVVGFEGVSGYVCRGVSPGGRLSEHATGSAVDILTFRLGDETQISVLDGWDDPEDGPILREVLEAACGRFGTVLGPDANDAHADHFHLDTAERRRPYCR